MYLQCLSAIATYWLNNFNFASNGLLHTQNTRAKQSDSYFIKPFLDDTLKFGSVYETEY